MQLVAQPKISSQLIHHPTQFKIQPFLSERTQATRSMVYFHSFICSELPIGTLRSHFIKAINYLARNQSRILFRKKGEFSYLGEVLKLLLYRIWWMRSPCTDIDPCNIALWSISSISGSCWTFLKVLSRV